MAAADSLAAQNAVLCQLVVLSNLPPPAPTVPARQTPIPRSRVAPVNGVVGVLSQASDSDGSSSASNDDANDNRVSLPQQSFDTPPPNMSTPPVWPLSSIDISTLQSFSTGTPSVCSTNRATSSIHPITKPERPQRLTPREPGWQSAPAPKMQRTVPIRHANVQLEHGKQSRNPLVSMEPTPVFSLRDTPQQGDDYWEQYLRRLAS